MVRLGARLTPVLSGVGGFLLGVLVMFFGGASSKDMADAHSSPAPVVSISPVAAELINQLDSELAVERFQAAEKLGELGVESEPAIPRLVALIRQLPDAQTDDEEAVSGFAAKALFQIGPRGAQAYCSEMSNRVPEIRHMLVRLIPPGAAGKPAVVSLVSRVSEDKGGIRALAAIALADIEDPSTRAAIPFLEMALKEETNPLHRSFLTTALNRIQALK